MTKLTAEKLASNQLNWDSKHNIILDVYNEEYSDKKEYWHYTSVKGFLSIFNHYVESCFEGGNVTECSMLASNIRFMNDLQEYREGVKAYERISHKSCDPDMNDSIYLISFCGKGDLLSQWKWYGKNSGLALCFDLHNTMYETYRYVNSAGTTLEDLDVYFDDKTKPIDVRYTNKAKKDLYTKLTMNNCISMSNAEQLIQPTFIPFCKDEGFKEEQESRLVFYVTDLLGDEERRPKFHLEYNTLEEGRVKPALKVGFHLNDETACISGAKNIISKVIVGPGANQELVFNSVIHLLDRINYSYQSSLVTKSKAIKWETFINRLDHDSHLVKCKDGMKREAYLCENGIVVMKSQIPFRG